MRGIGSEGEGWPVKPFRYNEMIEEALRGVVRRVLRQVAENGLPGAHHFYITFRTTAPGVEIADRLREKYPEEMTIVLQYEFVGPRGRPTKDSRSA